MVILNVFIVIALGPADAPASGTSPTLEEAVPSEKGESGQSPSEAPPQKGPGRGKNEKGFPLKRIHIF